MKKLNYPKWLRGICAGLMLGGGALIFTGCEATVSTPGTEAYYDYDYYPDADVYYYPAGRVYYWNDDGRWRSGSALPPHYVIREEHYEHYRSHSRQPWTERHEGEGRPGQMWHENHEDHDRDHD